MCTQGINKRINLHNRNNTAVMRHQMPDGLQASSHRAREVFGTTPHMKGIIKVVKQDGTEK